MSPRSLVHQSKKEALFQLCNFLCSSSVTSTSDLADGEIFLNTIQAKFPLYSNECPLVEVKSSEVQSNEDDVDNDEKKEPCVINPPIPETSENESNPAKKNILLRYNYIQKFIDDHYKIKSDEIISYEECENISELDLFKVAAFVLSEIVRHLLEINNEYLCTLFHLDIKFQIELEELFKLFISERQNITKLEVEKILSKSAKKVSPFHTPRRASLRNREQKSDSPPTPKEDIFTNSPLKAYFESPVFKKEEIVVRDKRIKNLEKNIEKIADERDEEITAYIAKISEMEKKLKKKESLEKDNKQLQMKIDELLTENMDLKASLEKMKENYIVDKNTWTSENQYLVNQVTELCNKVNDLQVANEKERSLHEDNKSLSQSSQLIEESASKSLDKIEPLKTEIMFLRERVKCLELKIHTYKKQLSQKLLTELKEKKHSGNSNRSYEEIWIELDKERKGQEETIQSIIVEDNRALVRKLNEANLLNKELSEEIERLKKKTVSNSKGTNRRKKICSVATVTAELNVPEKDISKTPEVERLRRSLNQSKNYEHYNVPNESSIILNNSDNLIPSEQSVISTEAEMSECSERLPEAVLWKAYDSSKPEAETVHGIALSDSVTENSHLHVINNLGVSNIKTGSDNLPNPENKYVLGNLNFDVFLNELKKLTKNGSFQKVLQVFGKCQKEINGTNRSSRLDLQELLKMITECVCVAVSLNTESAIANHQDKCCSTDEIELFMSNKNSELEKLKNELSSISQNHDEELKDYKKKLEKLTKEKNLVDLLCQASDQKISEQAKTIEEMYGKYEEQRMKIGSLSRKYAELKKAHTKQLDITQKQFATCTEMEKRQHYLFRRSQQYENLSKVLKKENNHLKEKLQKLKEENENFLKEKEIKSVASAACSRDSCVGVPNHFNIKSELHSSTFQDTANESMLSGAFHKSISHYVSENEDDFFNINSLNSIKKEYVDERIEELKRRNSFLPFHLQTSYPVEANLEATYESLYVKDGEKCKEEQLSKKRKLEDPEESSISSTIQTPVAKLKRKIETPKSLQKFIKTIKYNNNKWFSSKQNGFPVKSRRS